MNLPIKNHITLKEFYKLREGSESRLEFVDGVVYMTPSPSTMHQRVSGRLHAQLFTLLDGKNCEFFMPLSI
ncbi:Uma2 family endonuclease [Bacillus sp. FJAT-45350]|uniref:Uma2 family endonuclease n=1 Tax=Bacillus sp. FJAT-45350 TaxID=2011014 RepID=UPI00359C922D